MIRQEYGKAKRILDGHEAVQAGGLSSQMRGKLSCSSSCVEITQMIDKEREPKYVHYRQLSVQQLTTTTRGWINSRYSCMQVHTCSPVQGGMQFCTRQLICHTCNSHSMKSDLPTDSVLRQLSTAAQNLCARSDPRSKKVRSGHLICPLLVCPLWVMGPGHQHQHIWIFNVCFLGCQQSE